MSQLACLRRSRASSLITPLQSGLHAPSGVRRPCSSSSKAQPQLGFRSAHVQRLDKHSRGRLAVAYAQPDQPPRNTEFGYSRKDVILIGFGIIALGYGLYYGLQAAGMEAGFAGNWVQLLVVLGLCVGWVGSYIVRVATKKMTYVTQLEQYEDAVMQKRIEEMTEDELQVMLGETETENAARRQKLAARQQEKQKD